MKLTGQTPVSSIWHLRCIRIYGSPRMVRELRGRGFPASKPRAERLMQENDIRARHKALTPNDFPCLAALVERLANFERYESLAHPFEWKFTRAA